MGNISEEVGNMKMSEALAQFSLLRGMGIEVPHPCMTCKHFKGVVRGVWLCKAFPKGIPREILLGFATHDKVHPKQEGDYVFSQRK